MRQGDFEMARTGWIADYNDAQSYLYLSQTSTKQQNYARFSNPEFDKLLTQAEGLLDVEKRRVVMAKLEEILLDDGPIIQPVWRALLTFMDKKVQGFQMHPTGYLNGNELAVSA